MEEAIVVTELTRKFSSEVRKLLCSQRRKWLWERREEEAGDFKGRKASPHCLLHPLSPSWSQKLPFIFSIVIPPLFVPHPLLPAPRSGVGTLPKITAAEV